MNIEYTFQDIVFEWDSHKAIANLHKHGIAFTLACEAFFDPFLYLADGQDADNEPRETIIGETQRHRMLCVVYTIRTDDRFRLISARPTTPAERLLYESQ